MVHKYDAFLNLLSAEKYVFQRDAVRGTLRFLVSEKYPDLERLARENWNDREAIRQRHESLDAYLEKMPLRDRKSISLDLATGTGKSFVMYALAAIALAEGLAERVLVLCPSLTIEDALLEKFTALAGNGELSEIMKELGAVVAIPGIKRGNETIQSGDICVENIHAVYENTGSSIRDSFRGRGARTLVLNDEAHHLFSPPDRGLKEWMKFLQHAGFRLSADRERHGHAVRRRRILSGRGVSLRTQASNRRQGGEEAKLQAGRHLLGARLAEDLRHSPAEPEELRQGIKADLHRRHPGDREVRRGVARTRGFSRREGKN